jgi:hypothetical protein
VLFSLRAGRRALAAGLVLLSAAAVPGARAQEQAPPVAEAPGDEAPDPGVAEQEDTDWSEVGAKALDLVVLRPLGALATLSGFAFFAISLPLVAPGGEIGTSWDTFVMAPVDYTFVRPLGEF